MTKRIAVGAVAYDPKVVTIWELINGFFRQRGVRNDYVLFSNYEAQVDALLKGVIDIAWNTPLAYLQAKERLGGQCLVLGMRNSDIGFSTVFIARAVRCAIRHIPGQPQQGKGHGQHDGAPLRKEGRACESAETQKQRNEKHSCL